MNPATDFLRPSRPYLGLLLLPGLLAACGGGVALEDLPAETASLVCGTFRDCAGPLSAPFTDSDCEGNVQASMEDGAVDRWKRAIDRGTLSYDAALMANCLTDLQNQGCARTADVRPAVCREAFIGTVALGGTCAIDEECEGDRRCVSELACPGQCEDRSADGGPCGSLNECIAGLRCVSGACRGPVAGCLGRTNQFCHLDEICVGVDGEVPGHCEPIAERTSAALGDSCDALEQELCQVGLACVMVGVDPAGDFLSECRASVAAGAACGPGTPSQCPIGYSCTANLFAEEFQGTCEPLPGEGARCANSLRTASCGPDLRCNREEGAQVCATVHVIGEACSRDGDCYSDRCEGGLCVGLELCEI